MVVLLTSYLIRSAICVILARPLPTEVKQLVYGQELQEAENYEM